MTSIAVLLLTYNRFEYAKTTLCSFLTHAHTEGELTVHIASDGDSAEYVNALADIAWPHVGIVTASNSERAGYGGNYNLALQTVHLTASHVLPLEDDWELLRDLDLDLYVNALSELNAGCIRMGYIGYTQALRGEFVASQGRHWLRLAADSPEPHVFAGHPRLETVEWERSVGPWTEGLFPGETEFEVAHRPEAREGVIWPIQEIKPYGDMFAHIGATRSW